MTNPVLNAVTFTISAVLLVAIVGLFWAGLGGILAALVNFVFPAAALSLWQGMAGILLLIFVGSFFGSSK